MLSWLESTAYSEWIVAGLVGWPLMLSMHAVGLAILSLIHISEPTRPY